MLLFVLSDRSNLIHVKINKLQNFWQSEATIFATTNYLCIFQLYCISSAQQHKAMHLFVTADTQVLHKQINWDQFLSCKYLGSIRENSKQIKILLFQLPAAAQAQFMLSQVSHIPVKFSCLCFVL